MPLVSVAIYGRRHPHLSSAERVEGAGWKGFGQRHLMPWRQVGFCWADLAHPVIALRRTPQGLWVPEEDVMLGACEGEHPPDRCVLSAEAGQRH
jgi:hypothetical protein